MNRYELLVKQESELVKAIEEGDNSDSTVEDLMDVRQSMSEWNAVLDHEC